MLENRELLQNLDKLCELRKLDLNGLKESTTFNYKSLLKSTQVDLGELSKVSDFFDISIQNLVYGTIDFDWVKNPELPSKYQVSQGSKMRTSLTPLFYIKKRYGTKVFNEVRRSLRIPLESLNHPDKQVSIELLVDILDLVSSLGVASTECYLMGDYITEIEENKEIGQMFRDITSPQQVFEKLFEDIISKYEINFNYNILKRQQNSLLVEVTQSDRVHEDLGLNLIGHKFLSIYRAAACAAHLKFIGNSFGFATKLESPNSRSEHFQIYW